MTRCQILYLQKTSLANIAKLPEHGFPERNLQNNGMFSFVSSQHPNYINFNFVLKYGANEKNGQDNQSIFFFSTFLLDTKKEF